MTEKYQAIKKEKLGGGGLDDTYYYTYYAVVRAGKKTPEIATYQDEDIALDHAAALNLGAESRFTPVFPRLEIS